LYNYLDIPLYKMVLIFDNFFSFLVEKDCKGTGYFFQYRLKTKKWWNCTNGIGRNRKNL